MNLIEHEQKECSGSHPCEKCGLTVQKTETKKNTHNCFNAMASYLSNMLESKDYIIQMFKEEISRKNQLIEDLLDKQDFLETRLAKIEAVLLFDDGDFEAQTGVKKEEEITVGKDSTKETSASFA
jgi:hypothetical protein